MTQGTPTASFGHLCYWYPRWSGAARPDATAAALFDVNLELGPGLTLVAGDSGAGKSTLLRVLNGLVPHFHGGRIAGSAVVAGLDVLRTPTRVLARHVGFVFQESEAGFVRGTVAREVAFGAENLGFRSQEVVRRTGDALERVGIAGLAERRLGTLSGGERQRVALAAVLAAAPELVALDEPTSQLDEAGVTALVGILEDLAAGGHAVVVAEHRVGQFMGADLVVAVSGGKASLGPGPPALFGPGPPASVRPGPWAGDGWALSGLAAGIAGRAVVEDVDLSGLPGEIVVLNGPNGSGKTTLLRTIAGLLPPLAGEVTRPAPVVGHGRQIGYLPQDPGALLHRRSVLAEVQQTLRWSRSSDDPMAILRQLGLEGQAGNDPRDLSTGQRQRAALAAVLVGRPALALLDEPTRGMDGASRLALVTTLRDLADGGACVVMATHDAALAEQVGDRVVFVAGGRATVETATRVGA